MRKMSYVIASLCLILALPVFGQPPVTKEVGLAGSNIAIKAPSSIAEPQQPEAPVLATASVPVYDGWHVQWMVAAGGGTTWDGSASGSGGTIGQAAVGTITGADATIHQGFWQTFSVAQCCDRRADVNHDGIGPYIDDLMYLVDFMFQNGDEPLCSGEADIDGDGEVVIIDDLIYLVTFMFQGGAPPAPCS